MLLLAMSDAGFAMRINQQSGLPILGFIVTVLFMEFDPLTYGLIASSFLLAGFVKGIVGLGLPTISLALLTALLDLPTAMALLVVPSFCTNIWQAIIGGHMVMLWRRLWPLLLAMMLMVWVGVALADHFETVLLTRVLGVILLLYAAVSLYAVPLIMPPALESWLAPICGALNGVLTGLTGSLFMPGVIYLQAMGLSRDQLVQAMGLLFALSTAALGVSLQDAGRIDPGLWQISGLALLPAFAGMQAGCFCRGHLSERLFRHIFLYSLATLGLYIMLV